MNRNRQPNQKCVLLLGMKVGPLNSSLACRKDSVTSFGVDDPKPVCDVSTKNKSTSKEISKEKEPKKMVTITKRKAASKKMVPPQVKRMIYATEDIHSWSSAH